MADVTVTDAHREAAAAVQNRWLSQRVSEHGAVARTHEDYIAEAIAKACADSAAELEQEALRYYNADGSFVVMESREEVVAARVAAARRIADLKAELASIKRPCSIRRGHEVEDIMAHGNLVLCSTSMVADMFDNRIKAEARATVLRDAAVRAARAFNAWGGDEDGIHPEAMPAVEQLRAVLNLIENDDLSTYSRRVLDAALAELPAGSYVFRKKFDDADSRFDAAVLTPDAVAALGDLGVSECALTMTLSDCVESLKLEVKP